MSMDQNSGDVFVKSFFHKGLNRVLHAEDYGKKAFVFRNIKKPKKPPKPTKPVQ